LLDWLVSWLIDCRDFVTLRHWKVSEDQVILSSGIAVAHPAMPPCSQHVRYEQPLIRSCVLSHMPRTGSMVVRIDPLRFLAGCRTRRLNQV